MDLSRYTDGFFSIDGTHGFLPIRSPLATLPNKYKELQTILDNLPIQKIDGSNGLLSEEGQLEKTIGHLSDFSDLVSKESDVFIIQGEGKRHWRVGLPDANLKQFAQNKSLLQVEKFPAVIDCVLEPGDILYIPPGCPHEGYAVENALNYSVGFRAPNQRDLLSQFADHLIDTELGNQRYGDAELKLRTSKGELSKAEAEKVKQLMIAAINDDAVFKTWLGNSMSQPKHDMDLAPLEEPYTLDDVNDLLNDEDVVFERLGGTRAIYQVIDDKILLSINGVNYMHDLTDLELITKLTDQTCLTSADINSSKNNHIFLKTFTTLLNEGIWFC